SATDQRGDLRQSERIGAGRRASLGARLHDGARCGAKRVERWIWGWKSILHGGTERGDRRGQHRVERGNWRGQYGLWAWLDGIRSRDVDGAKPAADAAGDRRAAWPTRRAHTTTRRLRRRATGGIRTGAGHHQ